MVMVTVRGKREEPTGDGGRFIWGLRSGAYPGRDWPQPRHIDTEVERHTHGQSEKGREAHGCLSRSKILVIRLL